MVALSLVVYREETRPFCWEFSAWEQPLAKEEYPEAVRMLEWAVFVLKNFSEKSDVLSKNAKSSI